MAYNAAFNAINTYAQEQGISFSEALNSMKQHPDFQKPKRGRPRKEQVDDGASPQMSKRPRGRPPAGATWSDDRQMYLDAHGNEYVKVDTPPTTRRRGRPPKGTTWDEASQGYVNQNGEAYQKAEKAESSRPRGRPPAGKHWDEATQGYIDNE